MRVAIYTRESHLKSSNDQLIALRQLALQSGYSVGATFSDTGNQCLNPREPMSGLDSLMKMAEKKVFVKVMVWDIAIFGNSLEDLVRLMHTLHSYGVDVLFQNQDIDTSNPEGPTVLKFVESMVHYQKMLMAAKIRAGQQRALERGVKLGRPTNMNESVRIAIRLLHQNGLGKKQIAKQLRVGVCTVIASL
jgi:DNA invertase Pin-like site-specific DNA recombinase